MSTTFIIIGIMILLAVFLIALGFVVQRRTLKRKHQAMLVELAPWLGELEKMDEEQLAQEYRRIRKLWMAAKESSEMLELQFELVSRKTMSYASQHHEHKSLFRLHGHGFKGLFGRRDPVEKDWKF